MRHTRTLPSVIAVLLVFTGMLEKTVHGAEETCGQTEECVVDRGSYYAREPVRWDGESALPVLIYFHGYGQTGRTVLAMKALTAAAEDIGALIIAPNGIDNAWSVRGAPPNKRDEVAFTASIVEDIAKRWPIDRSRVWIAGFSLGASIAWDIACLTGNRYAGYMPVSGSFWRPHPAACPGGPVTMIHVHGRADRVVPLEGRTIREQWRQGDVFKSFEILRRHNHCKPAAVESSGPRGLQCREWNQCDAGSRLALCLYDGGHAAPQGWYPRAFEWLKGTGKIEPAG